MANTKQIRISAQSANIGAGADGEDFALLITQATIAEATNPEDFWSDVKSDGGDLRAYSDSGQVSRLAIEVVAIDTGAETLTAYIRRTGVSSSADTDIYLEFGDAALTQPAVGAAFGRNAVWVDKSRAIHGTASDSSGNSSDDLSSSNANTIDDIGSSVGSLIMHFDPSAWTGYSSDNKDLITRSTGGGYAFSVLYNRFSAFRDFVFTYRGAFGSTLVLESSVKYTSDTDFDGMHVLQLYWDKDNGIAIRVDNGSSSESEQTLAGTSNAFTPTTSITIGDASEATTYETFIVQQGASHADFRAAEFANQVNPASFFDVGDVVDLGGGGSTVSITGNIPVSIDSSAGNLQFNQNPALSGNVPLSIVPTASLSKHQNPSILGGTTVSIVPISVLSYSASSSITGDVDIAVIPGAGMVVNRVHAIVGDVPATLIPDAALNYSQGNELVGSIAINLVPVGILNYSQSNTLIGDITISVTPNAGLAFSQGLSIVGSIPISMTPTATAAYVQNHSLLGDVTFGVLPTASLQYLQGGGIIGDIGISVDVAAGLAHNINPSVTGDVTVQLVPTATFTYAAPQAITLTGDLNISLIPDASLVFGDDSAILRGIVFNVPHENRTFTAQ